MPELCNRLAVIARLEWTPPGKPISFAFVWDSHDSAVFNQILKELSGKGVDFIVHLGILPRLLGNLGMLGSRPGPKSKRKVRYDLVYVKICPALLEFSSATGLWGLEVSEGGL